MHSAGAGFFVSDQATFWSRKTPYSLGGVVGWKGPRGRPLERGPGNVVLWLCAILMAVEMVVANGSFCFLFFGPEGEPNPGPWILGPTEIACATNWAISAFPDREQEGNDTECTALLDTDKQVDCQRAALVAKDRRGCSTLEQPLEEVDKPGRHALVPSRCENKLMLDRVKGLLEVKEEEIVGVTTLDPIMEFISHAP